METASNITDPQIEIQSPSPPIDLKVDNLLSEQDIADQTRNETARIATVKAKSPRGPVVQIGDPSLYESTMSRLIKRKGVPGPLTSTIDTLRQSIEHKSIVDTRQLAHSLEQQCLALNQKAMRQLQENQPQLCMQTLKQAESIVLSINQIRPTSNEKFFSLTLNNFGCYYKKVQKPRVALKYMKMALSLEKTDTTITGNELASTYLNLCAIYSELGNHSEAILKAVKSVMLVRNYLQKLQSQYNNDEAQTGNDLEKVIKEGESQKSLKQLFGKPRVGNDVKELGEDLVCITNADEESELLRLGMQFTNPISITEDTQIRGLSPLSSSCVVSQQGPTDEEITSVMGTYCAAYFNLGVSFEHLRQFKLSGQAYERAIAICKLHMPKNKALINSLAQAITALQLKASKQHETNFLKSVVQNSQEQSKFQQKFMVRRSFQKLDQQDKRSAQLLSPVRLPDPGSVWMRQSLPNKIDSNQQKKKLLESFVANEMEYRKGKQKSCLQVSGNIKNKNFQEFFSMRQQLMKTVDSAMEQSERLPTESDSPSKRTIVQPKVGVLPKGLNQELKTKSPGGGTISFDCYVKKRLYRNQQQPLHKTINSQSRRFENLHQIDFPTTPEEIPGYSAQLKTTLDEKPRTAPGGKRPTRMNTVPLKIKAQESAYQNHRYNDKSPDDHVVSNDRVQVINDNLEVMASSKQWTGSDQKRKEGHQSNNSTTVFSNRTTGRSMQQRRHRV